MYKTELLSARQASQHLQTVPHGKEGESKCMRWLGGPHWKSSSVPQEKTHRNHRQQVLCPVLVVTMVQSVRVAFLLPQSFYFVSACTWQDEIRDADVGYNSPCPDMACSRLISMVERKKVLEKKDAVKCRQSVTWCSHECFSARESLPLDMSVIFKMLTINMSLTCGGGGRSEGFKNKLLSDSCHWHLRHWRHTDRDDTERKS